MVERKYRNASIESGVYVSSTGHWFFSVSWDIHNREGVKVGRHGGDWDGDHAFLRGVKSDIPTRLPDYLNDELDRCVYEKLKAGELRFYEYNRDGVKRYENLRYVDTEIIASRLQYLSEKYEKHER